MSDGHVALIVEDDPHAADVLLQIVASLGHSSLRASTLEEVRSAVDAGGYCYVLLDMQIPAVAKGIPLRSSGETALGLLRKRDPRRNEQEWHVLPILVVTAFSKEPEFVSRMHKLGADGFVVKRLDTGIEPIADEIRTCLREAGRDTHAACAALGSSPLSAPQLVSVPQLAQPAAPPAAIPIVRLDIVGTRNNQRTDILINGRPLALPDALFVPLLHLVVAHQQNPGVTSARYDLGIALGPQIPYRIRKAVANALPAGFDLIDTVRAEGVRLNTAVTIGSVNWPELAHHANPAVRKLANEHLKSPAR